MFDFDIAALYKVETKLLNEQVKRNIERFPDDFMFRLSEKEWQNMRSQFATAYKSKRNSSLTPYVFTEHGVTMLAGVLRSGRAIKMSIAVVRIFIELKKNAINHPEIAKQIKLLGDRIGEHDVQLGAIYEAVENMMDEKAEEKVKKANWEERERIRFKK